MLIRPAEADDLDLVCRMRLAFLADHRGVDACEFSDDFDRGTRTFLRRHQQAGTIRSWLAETDRCVGIVSMLLLDLPPQPEEPRTREGYLINLYVEPSERDRGTGRALLETCIAETAGLDIRRLLLRATAAGRPMYVDTGFGTNDDLMEMLLPRSGDAVVAENR